MKHYITFNKKYYNESTALERSVINYSWVGMDWGVAGGGGGGRKGVGRVYVCVRTIELLQRTCRYIYDNITSRYPKGHVIPILMLLLVFYIS